MKYILAHYKEMTSKQMANIILVEQHKVALFCQSNNIQPVPEKKHRKDDYHTIPEARKQRMKRIDYNGPQKKTA